MVASPNTKNLRLSVENFGPIRAGQIEFKPLTILIGPNNAGKSYVAHLLYALWKALSGKLHRPFTSAPSFDDFLDQQLHDEAARVAFDRLPKERQDILRAEVEHYSLTLENSLSESIRRYFGCLDIRELVRGESNRRSLAVAVNPNVEGDPFLRVAIDANGLSTSGAQLDTSQVAVPLSADPSRSPMSDDPFTLGLFARHLWTQILALNDFPTGNMYYMPAARSGIIMGLEAYTTAAIDRVWRGAGREPLVFAPFPGVAADFLQVMVALGYAPEPAPDAFEALRPAIDVLEETVLGGRIIGSFEGAYRLGMAYEVDGMQMPIHRTSAMVAELAPLDLWMKHLLRPGDVLIIDEPEAHLHPENQRLIARVLVRLVRAGVRVICPTHSSLIIHQISNHLIASEVDQPSREAEGFGDDDLLRPDDVGVYLFQPKRDGTRIEPVLIEPDWGISEEEFVRVSEAIGEETYRLSEALRIPATAAV